MKISQSYSWNALDIAVWILLRACVLSPVLSTLSTLFLTFTATSLSVYYFIPEEDESQKD